MLDGSSPVTVTSLDQARCPPGATLDMEQSRFPAGSLGLETHPKTGEEDGMVGTEEQCQLTRLQNVSLQYYDTN